MVTFPQDIPTNRNLYLLSFSYINNLFYVCVLPIALSLFVCLTIPQKFPVHSPIRHTANIYSHMHKIQYTSITEVCFIHFVGLLTVDMLHISIDILQLHVIIGVLFCSLFL